MANSKSVDNDDMREGVDAASPSFFPAVLQNASGGRIKKNEILCFLMLIVFLNSLEHIIVSYS